MVACRLHILFWFKGLSDISGVTQKSVTKNLTDGFLMVRKQASDLKGDLRQIRRLHQLSKESLQESIHETMKKIAVSLTFTYVQLNTVTADMLIMKSCLQQSDFHSLRPVVLKHCEFIGYKNKFYQVKSNLKLFVPSTLL